MDGKFVENLKGLDMGPLKYEKAFSIWNTAKNCAATVGVATAGAGAVMGASGGSVVLPVVGSVPGAVAGALSGMFYGTVACTAMNLGVKEQVKKIFEP